MEMIELEVNEGEENQRLDKFLVGRLALTRTRVKALIDQNMVRGRDEFITTASRKVHKGDIFIFTLPDVVEAIPQPENIPLTIVYEDADLLVLNKPVGLVVHPAPGHYESTLVNALLAHCGESLSGIGGVRRPGIVHRLDKDTSGLMVIAKNDQAHQRLSAQFANRTLRRSYWAFVWGIPKPKQGIIEQDIGRCLHNRQKMAVVTKQGKPAITQYQIIKQFLAKDDASQGISLVQCNLMTGRTHQIRVHMAHLGHSLVGDPIYGRIPKWAKKAFDPTVLAFPRQALHAFQLTFAHPTTNETMSFEAPLPQDLKTLASSLLTSGKI
jgi:23S rRNA pseudouridine1911/1915/1917 synthase